jgi:hypothetical protein
MMAIKEEGRLPCIRDARCNQTETRPRTRMAGLPPAVYVL